MTKKSSCEFRSHTTADYVFLSKYAQKKREERKLAEQYGMSYGEEMGDAKE